MASPSNKTDICNMMLGRIGSKRVTTAQITADTEVLAQHCNLHYEQTRDALVRSHRWRFAGARIKLASTWATAKVYTTDQYVENDDIWYKCATAHTSSALNEPPSSSWTTLSASTYTPDFEWDYMFDLPADFLAMRPTYDDNDTIYNNTLYSYVVEGSKYYTNEATVEMRYTKQVTDVTKFDPLFIEVLVLSGALKLVLPISQDEILYRDLKEELYGRKGLMSRVRAMDRQEQNTRGQDDFELWTSYFADNRDPTKLGS